MARFYIERAEYGVAEGGMACGPVSGPVVAEVKIRTEKGETFFLSLAEVDGFPSFFKTIESTYEDQIEMNEEVFDILNAGSIEGGEYEELFEEQEHPEWYQIYRYLIYLVRADFDECEDFVKTTTGKYVDEIDIPASDLEEEYLAELDDEDYDDVEMGDIDEVVETIVANCNTHEDVFKQLLRMDTSVNSESVFNDMDANSYSKEKEIVEKLKGIVDLEAYEKWKEKYINAAYKRIQHKKYLTCTYVFAGIGQYEMTIPAEELESFMKWIQGNGSAFYGGEREATEEEIKKYIALNTVK